MSKVENNMALYVLERATYIEYLKKGVARLDNLDLVVLHAILARCGSALDKDSKLIHEVEHELFFRLNKQTFEKESTTY
ncbi:MAG TPA: hypothetical protein VI698_01650 [Nitrososphaerales archaeon]|nr:hypothetical protein [Nitrososphaerales archaeon]